VATALGAGFLITRPCHSRERGTDERVKWLVRPHFPKGMDFRKVTDGAVKAVQDLLNRNFQRAPSPNSLT